MAANYCISFLCRFQTITAIKRTYKSMYKFKQKLWSSILFYEMCQFNCFKMAAIHNRRISATRTFLGLSNSSLGKLNVGLIW